VSLNKQSLSNILKKTLEFSKERDYRGYDKADGMSSKILQTLPIDNKWINLAFQESVKRAPINLRPLLLVEKKHIPKGTALFTLSNLNLYRIEKNKRYLEEAKKLAEWLVSHQVEGYSGFCLSHSHPLQGLNKKTQPDIPNVVSTSYGVKSLLEISRFFPNKDYDKIAKSASDFIFNDLDYHEVKDTAKIKYTTKSPSNSFTLNANALGARLLIDLYSEFNEDKFLEGSTKILNYVVSKQTDQGGWMYTDPPSASHLSMDNYHNGFIIESILGYQQVTGTDKFKEELNKALDFYKNILHNDDGSPNWDEKNEYPKDIHAAAQGIITFTMAEDIEFAKKILEWTLNNLYAGDGRFYYQKRRFYTKKFTLMRWCQAWMAYAISKCLTER